MITLTQADLDQLTGADLLDQIARSGRHPADLDVDGRQYRIYTFTARGARRGTVLHLWAPGTHICGPVQQRIMDYECSG